MKIFFINNARLCSGAEEHLLDLGRAFRSLGAEPIYIAREKGPYTDRAQIEGFRVFPVFYTGIRKLLTVFQLARLIYKERPHILSVNREHNLLITLLALILAFPLLRRRPQLVAVFHTPTGRYYPFLRWYDGVICTSRYTASAFFRNNPSIEAKTTIIHYGIAPGDGIQEDKERPERLRRLFPDRSFPVIAMVGELWKNQEELIDVLPALKRDFPGITIAIVGGGDADVVESFKSKVVAARAQESIIVTGRIPRDRISDLFYDCDLSVSTHRNEGFGIVHIESLAAGTPVVAYNNGGLVEILGKGGGVLVNGKTEEFAAAIIDLLKKDDFRIAIGRQGRAVVEKHFTLDTMSHAHYTYYVQLLQGGR